VLPTVYLASGTHTPASWDQVFSSPLERHTSGWHSLQNSVTVFFICFV